MVTPSKKKKGEKFNDKDLDYFVFSVNEHMTLLEENCSCPWENTVAEHNAHAQEIIQKLSLLKGRGTKPKPKEVITDDDYFFLEFVVNERVDFLFEGQGSAWNHGSPRGDVTVGVRLLAKLRKILGLQSGYFFSAAEQ